MNKNKFLTLLIGECWHEWEWKPKDGDIHIYECAKCGLRVGGRPQHPDHLSNPLPVIRWMEKEMPEVWNEYVASFMSTVYCDRTIATRALNFTLDLSNLITYLSDHREWGEKECPHYIQSRHSSSAECALKGTERCKNECEDTGIIKHPALKYMEAEDEQG